jgi:hypothetical protein
MSKIINNTKPFKSLTPDMKRMKVLRDAVKLITTKKLVMSTGFVFEGFPLNQDGQLRPLLNKHLSRKDAICEVCQRGALLCSLVLNDNAFKTRELVSQGTFSEYGKEQEYPTDRRLSDVFSKEQIALMETAFEGEFNRLFLGEELYAKAVEFSSQFQEPYERSLAILNNAIANKGIFNP